MTNWNFNNSKGQIPLQSITVPIKYIDTSQARDGRSRNYYVTSRIDEKKNNFGFKSNYRNKLFI